MVSALLLMFSPVISMAAPSSLFGFSSGLGVTSYDLTQVQRSLQALVDKAVQEVADQSGASGTTAPSHLRDLAPTYLYASLQSVIWLCHQVPRRHRR